MNPAGNPIDDQLKRLFRAAAKADAPAPQEVPFGLETRVLAAWRDGRSQPAGFWNSTVLVRGLLVAGLIMALSFLPAYNSLTSSSTSNDPYADFLTLTDSTVSSDQTE